MLKPLLSYRTVTLLKIYFKEGGGRDGGLILKVHLTLSGDKVNLSTAPSIIQSTGVSILKPSMEIQVKFDNILVQILLHGTYTNLNSTNWVSFT